MEETWLPITEYSRATGNSISTVRRQLKRNDLLYKKNKGKYFIRYCGQSAPSELLHLRQKIQKLQEEKDDLLMLVRLYEKERH